MSVRESCRQGPQVELQHGSIPNLQLYGLWPKWQTLVFPASIIRGMSSLKWIFIYTHIVLVLFLWRALTNSTCICRLISQCHALFYNHCSFQMLVMVDCYVWVMSCKMAILAAAVENPRPFLILKASKYLDYAYARHASWAQRGGWAAWDRWWRWALVSSTRVLLPDFQVTGLSTWLCFLSL